MKKKSDTSSPFALNKQKATILFCIIAAVIVVVAVVLLLSGRGSGGSADNKSVPTTPLPTISESMLHGDSVTAEQFTGSWVTYANGKKLVYTYDNDGGGQGCAVFRAENGDMSEYHYEIQNDRIILTAGEKRQVYIWSSLAVTFIADHEYGEAAQLTALVGNQIDGFSGYMFAQGDYLYVGKLCLCREDRLDGSGDKSLVGTWTGASGDRVTFTQDGAYHYRETGFDYDGTFSLDEETQKLTLKLPGTNATVLSDSEWSISGRVLRLRNHYYFRDNNE